MQKCAAVSFAVNYCGQQFYVIIIILVFFRWNKINFVNVCTHINIRPLVNQEIHIALTYEILKYIFRWNYMCVDFIYEIVKVDITTVWMCFMLGFIDVRIIWSGVGVWCNSEVKLLKRLRNTTTRSWEVVAKRILGSVGGHLKDDLREKPPRPYGGLRRQSHAPRALRSPTGIRNYLPNYYITSKFIRKSQHGDIWSYVSDDEEI